MIFVFFAIIALMRVVQSICGKQASIEVKNNKIFFLYGIYYEALAAIFAFITVCFSNFSGLTLPTFICGLVTAVFLMIQFYANLYAIKGCKIIIASMFAYGGLLISCILSWIFFDEPMSIIQCAGLLLFFLSAYLLSSNKTDDGDTQPQKISKSTWVLLIISMLGEGGVEFSQKYFSLKITDGNVAGFSFFMFVCSAIIMATGFLIMCLKEKHSAKLLLRTNEVLPVTEKTRLNKILLICGALLAFAVFIINLLVTELGKTVSTAILFPVSASIATCITSLVGLFIYKEKLSIKNVLGIVLGLVSIIMLAVFTPETMSDIF